jgi:nucleoid-associated protein YgaU
MFFVLLCLVGWGGAKGYDAVSDWARGPLAVRNFAGRFHYEYDSITKGMVYVPGPAAVESAGGVTAEGSSHSLGFTRRKASSGADIGRIEVVVERVGTTLKVAGKVPNLYVRYLVEQSLWDIPGVSEVDLRTLVVDRTYRVNKGDSLWIIAKRLYGEGSAWTLLAKVNDIENPSFLKIGQELALPLGNEVLVQEK